VEFKKLKAIISGGGTGGHIYPAIAIAKALQKRLPETEILFVGANGRMEMEKIPQAGYKIEGLNIAGIQRGSILKNIALPGKLFQSLRRANSILNTFKPDVAIGVGGYASGPLLFAAGLKGIPTVIQEQNSYAGITNKLLARTARVICTAYKGMDKVFPAHKVIMTGNPIREEIVNMQADHAAAYKYFGLDENKKTLLIIGGSLGARTLNESVEAAKDLIKTSNIQVLWQTGKIYFEKCEQVAADIENLKPRQFIDRMDYAYTVADVIISRAGALSISELQIVGKPVILVPSPNVSEDHQTHNAKALVDSDAAIMIFDSNAKEKLVRESIALMNDEHRKEILSLNIKKMGIPDAADRIVDEILKAVKA
jgi:UDP-N-acetylglucosamine--N-acetylmuramyl-(pentapeptide) pyrophosphoryl-undecaprenol N-acetylglucosamine transferase